MKKSLLEKMKEQNLRWKISILSPFFRKSEKVLDFGSGNMEMAARLAQKNKKLKITGVDIIEFPDKVPGLKFVKYSGKKLPFRNDSFDTVISFYVLHHCPSVETALKECLRVSKKRVIVVEAVARFTFEKYPMMMVDWLCNVWKKELLPFTFNFYTDSEWERILGRTKADYRKEIIKSNPFALLPIGAIRIFVITKK